MNSKLNLALISFTSFMAYFVMSAVITPLGVVSGPIASYFSVELTTATAVFSALTFGILAGAIIAIFIFDYLRIKSVVLLSSLLIIAALLLIYISNSFTGLTIGLSLTGIGCGVALSTAATVITHAWREKMRPSMLLLTDSFYSIAGTLSTITAAWLLAQQWHWWSAYLLALSAVILLFVIAAFSDYPQPKAQFERDAGVEKWPPSVYLCALALMMYLMGVVVVYSWVPNYAQSALGMDPKSAGQLVGTLFSGMFFGQLVVFFLVLVVPVRLLLTICIAVASVMTYALWADQQLLSISRSMLLLGLFGGGILKVAIAYGTTLSLHPSPKMISFLLFHTALGTAIAPALSAWVVSQSSIAGALAFATFCYVACAALLLASFMPSATPLTALSDTQRERHRA